MTIEERKWIPCSERLPEDKNRYLITSSCKFDDSDEVSVNVDYILARYIDGKWVDEEMENIEFDEGDWFVKVVAWAKPPEPYKEEGD